MPELRRKQREGMKKRRAGREKDGVWGLRREEEKKRQTVASR